MSAHQPDTNPKTRAGAAKPPLGLVPRALLLAAAGAFKLGAEKYGFCNWHKERVSASVYFHAGLRHFYLWWEGEDVDPESGAPHLGHLAACIGIVLDAAARGMLNDDRPHLAAEVKGREAYIPDPPGYIGNDAEGTPLFVGDRVRYTDKTGLTGSNVLGGKGPIERSVRYENGCWDHLDCLVLVKVPA